MNVNCENHYKLCRENAGMTQEHATELLDISTRSLSDYENGHSSVPEAVVDAMARHYQSPLLAWWHMKHRTLLGKYLPDIFMPQTHGDMAFQSLLASDDLNEAARIIKKIMANGKIEKHERDCLKAFVACMKSGKSKAISAIIYAEEILDKMLACTH